MPSRPDAARRVGAVVRHRRLAQQRFDDRRGEHVGQLLQLVARVERATAGENDDLLALRSGSSAAGADRLRRGSRAPRATDIGRVMPECCASNAAALTSMLLEVDREGDVRHARDRQRGPAGEIRDVLDVRRTHDAPL